MVEKNLIEHPSVISLPALNEKINKSAKPYLVKGNHDMTMYLFTNDGVLALV